MGVIVWFSVEKLLERNDEIDEENKGWRCTHRGKIE